MKLSLLLLTVLFLLPLPAALAGPGSAEFDRATQFFNSGQYPEAVAGFSRELQTNPQDALTHYYLGLCFHTIGRYPDATREYNWILLNTQDPELIKRVQLGLKALANQMHSQPQATMPQAVAMNQAPAITQAAPPAQPPHWVPLDPTVMSTLPTKAFIQNPNDAAPAIGPTGSLRVVDCYTTWCGWCRKLEPVVKKAQSEYRGKVVFERVDAEAPANQSFVKRYNVHSYPTLLFFDATGRLVGRVDGFPQGHGALEALVERTFGITR